MNSLKEVMAEDKRAHQQRMSDLREEEQSICMSAATGMDCSE